MKVEQVQIAERPLIDAYRHRFQEVQDFFEYDPNQVDSFHKRYQYLQGKSYERSLLVDALADYNEAIGASSKTMENIERLRDQATVAVLTGQQAGVLTGPLYTIYKALTILQLAERLTNEGMPAVPVFWIASEDHDFYEIAGINFLNRDHEEVEVRLQAEVGREPIGRLKLKAEVEQFLEEFKASSPDTDFKAEMLDTLQQMAAESTDLAQWFGRIMAWVFADTGLIFIDSLDPALRRLGKDFFLQVLDKTDQITTRLEAAEEALAGKGFPVQVKTSRGQVQLFLLEDDARYPLEYGADGYSLRGEERYYTYEEIRERIQREPEQVSTNVVTRPLFQDLLFPTIAYIGGPGETAYFAEYRQIYKLFDMQMPIIYPRASLTLIERTIAKGLDKYELTFLDIHQRFTEVRNEFLQEADEMNLKERFGRLKGSFVPEYQKLVKDLQELDPKFKELGAKNLQRILEQVNYLEEKANHQHRKNSDDLLRHLDKLKINLSPADSLQERRFNIFPYLFKYQIELVRDLNQLDLLAGLDHYLIYL